MFDAIKDRVGALRNAIPHHFVSGGGLFHEIPDNHSVAVVSSHLGKPLYQIVPGKYEVHDETPQINSEPLDRYKEQLGQFLKTL